ncbi:MAG: GNAT family N-acetyltransferase [Proteobacteria bacterium]|nr:GNAT family N-acetyltransferase [Pseudomonadota bacterium]
MTTLAPMRPGYFGTFSERTISGYAHENIASFRWDEATALKRARTQFRRLLPQGLATPGNHLLEILDHPGGKTVGGLWFDVSQDPGLHAAHLYDLHVDREFLGSDHAQVALKLVEARCRGLGAATLELQIFAHNTIAHALYNSLGFSVASFNLIKRLDEG